MYERHTITYLQVQIIDSSYANRETFPSCVEILSPDDVRLFVPQEN